MTGQLQSKQQRTKIMKTEKAIEILEDYNELLATFCAGYSDEDTGVRTAITTLIAEAKNSFKNVMIAYLEHLEARYIEDQDHRLATGWDEVQTFYDWLMDLSQTDAECEMLGRLNEIEPIEELTAHLNYYPVLEGQDTWDGITVRANKYMKL